MERPTKELDFSERRLQRAMRYVSDGWIPLNPALLYTVRLKINDPAVTSDQVLDYLKQDLALFSLCFRRLAELLASKGVTLPQDTSLRTLIETAGLDELKRLLATPDLGSSNHSIDSAGPQQLKRLQEALLSATTAEVLCDEAEIDPQLGFATSVLRQLGLTLIAWNYPQVYQAAITRVRTTGNLDAALTTELGFAPMTLALRLVKSWGLTNCAAVATFTAEGERLDSGDIAGISTNLAAICRTGEALARANNPELYPSARSDWQEAQAEISRRLGPAGMAMIQECFERRCGAYLELIPDIFRPGMIVDPDVQRAAAQSSDLLVGNPFIDRCPTHIRARLTHLYASLKDNVVEREPITVLLHDIIPFAGYTGAQVYTIEPSLMKHVAQTQSGKIHQPHAATIDYDDSGPVAAAFTSPTPIIWQSDPGDGKSGQQPITQIGWAIGVSQRVGTLIVELPTELFEASPAVHLTEFNAFAQTLNDCLKLR